MGSCLSSEHKHCCFDKKCNQEAYSYLLKMEDNINMKLKEIEDNFNIKVKKLLELPEDLEFIGFKKK